VRAGDTVVLFGKDGPVAGGTGYAVTAANGVVLTHYLTDMAPGATYTLTGANQATATASPQGVLTFTTTGSKTITIGLAGDLNLDGIVDTTDFTTLMRSLNHLIGAGVGDIDGDGVATFNDFQILELNFGKGVKTDLGQSLSAELEAPASITIEPDTTLSSKSTQKAVAKSIFSTTRVARPKTAKATKRH